MQVSICGRNVQNTVLSWKPIVQFWANLKTFIAEGAEGGDASSESSERGESTVESILFNSADANNLTLLTGTLDGNVSVWDVSSHVKRHTVNVGDGVVKMSWRKGSTRFDAHSDAFS